MPYAVMQYLARLGDRRAVARAVAVVALLLSALLLGTPARGQARVAEARPPASPEQLQLQSRRVPPSYKPIRYVRRGRPLHRVGGGTRSDTLGPTVIALAPSDHVARTASAQPALFWLAAGLEARGPVRITLTIVADSVRQERALHATLGDGLRRIDLSRVGIALRPGRPYRWLVRVHPVSGRSPDLVSNTAWIERASSPAEMRNRLSRTNREGGVGRVRALAAAGLWYDALAVLSDLIDSRPDDRALRELRADFLSESTGWYVEP